MAKKKRGKKGMPMSKDDMPMMFGKRGKKRGGKKR
jgi:hypothetical protein